MGNSKLNRAGRRTDPARLPVRAQCDLVLTGDLQRVFDANFSVYGMRKVRRQLGREGRMSPDARWLA